MSIQQARHYTSSFDYIGLDSLIMFLFTSETFSYAASRFLTFRGRRLQAGEAISVRSRFPAVAGSIPGTKVEMAC
jgi:hypothetical protein